MFNFQKEAQSLHMYTDHVFRTADFLEYNTSKQQSVERVVKNCLLNILAQAALLDMQQSLKELYQAFGSTEEKTAVSQERQIIEGGWLSFGSGRIGSRNVSNTFLVQTGALASVSPKCLGCGQSGHLRRTCPQRTTPEGNGQSSGCRRAPRRLS